MPTTNTVEIKTWLIDYVSKALKIAPEQISGAKAFDRYGMDSVAVVAMTGDLSEWLGVEVSPTLAYDYPTIDAISDAIAQTLKPSPVNS